MLRVARNDICSAGRSMIEMLGVLAIVGVLSVGGIAGYSKAMSAYKLNKWIYQIREMISGAQTLYMNQKTYGDTEGNSLLNTFTASGIIPEGMLQDENQDMYGNRLFIVLRNKKTVVDALRIAYRWLMPANKEAVECCAKLYELAHFYNNLWVFGIENDFSYGICGNAAPAVYKEDQACQPYDFIKAKQNCKKCETQNCTMLLILDNSAF